MNSQFSSQGNRSNGLPSQNAQSSQQEQASQSSLAGKWVTLEAAESRDDGMAALTFSFDQQLVDYLKVLPSPFRQWNNNEKAWMVPSQHVGDVSTHLREQGIRVRQDVDYGLVRQKLDMVPNLCQAEKDERIASIPQHTWRRLFEYQRKGIAFGVQRKGRALITDEPGLGKTVQAVLIAAAFLEDWPLLVICPASMGKVWHDHLREWLPEDVLRQACIRRIISGKEGKALSPAALGDKDITIVSYDLASQIDPEAVSAHGFIICDECHMLKGEGTKRSHFIAPRVKAARHAVLLSGTPLQGRVIQLYPLIEMVRPGLLGTRDEFGVRYCGNLKKQVAPGVFEYTGASQEKELHVILAATIMVHRTKRAVLTELPDKIRSSVPVEISGTSLTELGDIRNEMDSLQHDSSMSKQASEQKRQLLIGELQRATARAKLEGTSQHLLDVLNPGDNRQPKVLVFAHHSVIMDGLEAALKAEKHGFVRIDGKTTASSRPQLVDRFQKDATVKVALLSIKAAGVGLTLTAANLVIFAELIWDPNDLVQAEDRAHRIGQTKALQVQYMVALAKESSDELMWKKLRDKLKIVGKIVDGHLEGSAAGLQMNGSRLTGSTLQFSTPAQPHPEAKQPPGAPRAGSSHSRPESGRKHRLKEPEEDGPSRPLRNGLTSSAVGGEGGPRNVRRKLGFEDVGGKGSKEDACRTATAGVIIDLTQDEDDTQEDAAKISGSGLDASTQPRSQPPFDPSQLGVFAGAEDDDDDNLALVDLTFI